MNRGVEKRSQNDFVDFALDCSLLSLGEMKARNEAWIRRRERFYDCGRISERDKNA